jgi:hypothetical protein
MGDKPPADPEHRNPNQMWVFFYTRISWKHSETGSDESTLAKCVQLVLDLQTKIWYISSIWCFDTKGLCTGKELF